MRVLFAEMPEASERDVSVELENLPLGTEVVRHSWDGNEDGLVEAARGARAILTEYVPFGPELLKRLEDCRIISVAATGWDCVDVMAAASAGISVAAVGEYCTQEVADHTLAMMLAMARRIPSYDRQVREDKDWRWDRVRGAMRLDGLRLGIVGFGRIGQAVAARAQGFGLQVMASDPYADVSTAGKEGVSLVGLSDLFRSADIISLHCNLTDANRMMLDARAFSLMERKPMLINVARGGLVDETALAAALDQGKVSAAALDVLQDDSPDLARHPLAQRENVLLTPHVAFYSEQSINDVRRISASNITAFLEGRREDVFRLVHDSGDLR